MLMVDCSHTVRLQGCCFATMYLDHPTPCCDSQKATATVYFEVNANVSKLAMAKYTEC